MPNSQAVQWCMQRQGPTLPTTDHGCGGNARNFLQQCCFLLAVPPYLPTVFLLLFDSSCTGTDTGFFSREGKWDAHAISARNVVQSGGGGGGGATSAREISLPPPLLCQSL